MTKRFLVLLLLIGGLFSVPVIGSPQIVSAHQSGCHRWHSCPSDSGSYVCGDLGYTSGCPGGGAVTTPAPTVSKPHVPVVTKETVTNDEPIIFETVTEYTSREYSSFSKITNEGHEGVKRTYTEVTYSDGSETSRRVDKTETVTQASRKITLIGKRISPEARITRFWSTNKKDHFDIKGTFKPNSEVVISVDGKKIKRAKTDGKGVFLFKSIKVGGAKPTFIMYERRNSKERQISEKTFVDKKTKVLTTEYEAMHKGLL